MQCEEPASCLVNAFGDEVGREVALEMLAVLERVMPLGKWHRARIEPNVDELGSALHRPATLTRERHSVGYWVVIHRAAVEIYDLAIKDFLQPTTTNHFVNDATHLCPRDRIGRVTDVNPDVAVSQIGWQVRCRDDPAG